MSTITETIRRVVVGDGEDRTGPVRADWNGAVLAESGRTVVVEGNRYFPPEDVKSEYLEPSTRHTVCAWKGTASYYDVVVERERNRDAAWHSPSPSRAATQVKDHVAFWRGVKIKRAPLA